MSDRIWIGILALIAGLAIGWTVATQKAEDKQSKIHIQWPGGGYHGEAPFSYEEQD